MARKIIYLLLSLLVLAGCQNAIKPLTNIVDSATGKVQVEQKKQADKTLAMIKCQELCQLKLSTENGNLSDGPCLSNEIISDWVCDIAHSPRQSADDDPANQCSAFRQGQAHHFVEVDGNCSVIKVY